MDKVLRNWRFGKNIINKNILKLRKSDTTA